VTPFADDLRVSMPGRLEDLAALRSVIDAAGFSCVFERGDEQLYRCADDGTVKLRQFQQVAVASASGLALRQLRGVGLFDSYLSVLGSGPHRVTGLHVAADIYIEASAIVRRVAARARAGKVQITRRAVAPGDIDEHLSTDSWGNRTGTVYLGKPSAELRVAIYDKRHEQWCRRGVDIGPCLRFELRVRSKIGATLRDAHSPAALFFHYLAPDLIRAPAAVQPWTPYTEGGFTLQPRPDFTPWELIDRKLAASADVRRLIELARAAGPHGMDLLCQRLRAMADAAETSGVGIARAVGSEQPAAEAASARPSARAH